MPHWSLVLAQISMCRSTRNSGGILLFCIQTPVLRRLQDAVSLSMLNEHARSEVISGKDTKQLQQSQNSEGSIAVASSPAE